MAGCIGSRDRSHLTLNGGEPLLRSRRRRCNGRSTRRAWRGARRRTGCRIGCRTRRDTWRRAPLRCIEARLELAHPGTELLDGLHRLIETALQLRDLIRIRGACCAERGTGHSEDRQAAQRYCIGIWTRHDLPSQFSTVSTHRSGAVVPGWRVRQLRTFRPVFGCKFTVLIDEPRCDSRASRAGRTSRSGTRDSERAVPYSRGCRSGSASCREAVRGCAGIGASPAGHRPSGSYPTITNSAVLSAGIDLALQLLQACHRHRADAATRGVRHREVDPSAAKLSESRCRALDRRASVAAIVRAVNCR